MSQGKTYKFHGTQLKVMTGLAATKPIVAITNAAQALVDVAAHGYTTTGVIKISGVVGMTDVNNRLFVFEVVDADTLRLVDEDSLNYEAYQSGGTVALATFSNSHCEEVGYSQDTGATPVIEDEMACGVAISKGAPRMGTVSLSFKKAHNAVQQAIEANRRSKGEEEQVIWVQVPSFPVASFDIGWFVQGGEDGAVGATWNGTASFARTRQRLQIAVG